MKTVSSSVFLLVLCLIVSGTVFVQPANAAKNVILLIGDGMGFQVMSILMTHEKARLLSGEGRNEKGTGIFTRLMGGASAGFVKTNPLGYIVTDSAAAATAIACGKKTLPEVLGKDSKGNSLKSVLNHAQDKGRKTGLVSTHCITDATPGAFYANVTSRNEQAEIANQLIATGVDVALGGGLKYFIPQSTAVSDYSSDMAESVKANSGYGGASGRKDNINLIEESKLKGYKLVHNKTELDDISVSGDEKLLGLFSPHHMSFEIDRKTFDHWQPSLNQMTEKALSVLDKSENGFFLMVEGASIDSAGHYNDAAAILGEMQAFAAAVETCLEYAKNHKDTLVVVTADHETGIPAFSYKKLRREAREVSFTGGETWKEHYDTIRLSDALIIDKQKMSFKNMFYSSKRDPQKLLDFMKKYTAYDYTLEMAKAAFEKMPERGSAVNFSDPLYDFASAGTIYFCNKIARGLSTQSGVVWATGHHGGTPVPIFAVGKGATAVRGFHDNTWISHYLRSVIR